MFMSLPSLPLWIILCLSCILSYQVYQDNHFYNKPFPFIIQVTTFLTDGLEDLEGQDQSGKPIGDDDMEQDDEILLAGSGVKKLGNVRGSAFSKYASNEVAITMNVDSPEEMMGLSKLREASQRKRMDFNAQLKGGNGAGVKTADKLGNSVGVSSGTGALVSKSVVVAGGATGVKNSKTNGKLPLKRKESTRQGR